MWGQRIREKLEETRRTERVKLRLELQREADIPLFPVHRAVKDGDNIKADTVMLALTHNVSNNP